MTLAQAQALVEELQAVCVRHHAVLDGSCFDEGMAGEIQIMSRDDWEASLSRRPLNHVVEQAGSPPFFSVQAIGA